MSFMNKIAFWKKSDDFSFDDALADDSLSSSNGFSGDSALPPDPSLSNNSFDSGSSFGHSPNQDLSADSMASNSSLPGSSFDSSSSSPPDPLADQSFSMDNVANLPSQDSFARPSPPPSFPNNNTNSSRPKQDSLGRSLAHNYIDHQELRAGGPQAPVAESTSQNSSSPNNSLEMLNLKIDAVKSELSSISQRLIRLEQLITEQNKKRGW